MSQNIIVIGLSAASMAFITKLKSFDQTSQVIAFSAEKDFPYNRCFLADFLTNESSLADIQLKPEDFFQKNNIQVYFNTKVTKIDPQNQQVFTDEKSYHYDYLFLGIGTRPFIPASLNNFDGQGVFTFHTLSDMHKISKFIETHNPKSAVVIGAGLNGIEAASSISSKGISVALIEAQNGILPGQADQDAANWLEALIRKKGLMIIKKHKVINLCAHEGFVSSVELDSGTKVATDLVIIAAGSKLNSELLENTGIELYNGSIVVNQNMQTNISNILASGDICVVPDMISKELTRSTTWSDAMLQGLCAATTLSSAQRLYPGMIGMRDSYFFGKDFYACGQTAGISGLLKTICKQTDQDLEIIFTQQGVLKGFMLVGDIARLSELKKIYVTQALYC